MTMGRRSVAALVALATWIAGLFVLNEVSPEYLLPVVGASVGAVGLVAARAYVRQQKGFSALLAAQRKESKRLGTSLEEAMGRLQAEVMAMRDLQHGNALSLAKTRRAAEEVEAGTRRLRRGLIDGGPGVLPSRVFHQLEALIGLYAVIRPRRQFPRLGSWPASPEMLAFLYGEIRSRRPGLVVECGSGVSTLVMAYALEHNGSGSLVALEHDAEYAATTRRLIAEHGLTADVRHAPLRPTDVGGSRYEWYDPEALPEGSIALLFVDGPPGNVGPRARFPAFPLLADRLARDGVIVVDDYDREDERTIVETWLAASTGWAVRPLEVDRGGALLYRTDR